MILGVFLSERTKENNRWHLTSLSCRAAGGIPSTDGVDLIRDAVRYVFQELIEAEATSAIGADRY